MKIKWILVAVWLLFFAFLQINSHPTIRSNWGESPLRSDAPWELLIQNGPWGGAHTKIGYPLVFFIVDDEVRRAARYPDTPPFRKNYKINFGAAMVNLAFFLLPIGFVKWARRVIRNWNKCRRAKMKKFEHDGALLD